MAQKRADVDWVGVEMELSAGGREDLAAWVHDNAVNCRAMADLLATIHRDGGHHTASVGLAQSCKDAESIVRELRSDDARIKSNKWTAWRPTKGGIYWVQFDHSIAPQSVEVYRLDEDDVWRARVVGGADIIGSHVASFQVSSLTNSLWNGPISAPTTP